MARILDYNGQEAERTATVASLVACRDQDDQLVQVTATTPEEAEAAEQAGIEMVVCMSDFVPAVRQGSGRVFVTSAIDFTGAVTVDELLAVAFESLTAGADAVITARRLEVVERLAAEDIPVMGHLGFVPKKSTIYGGVRGVGKTAAEALELWDRFRRLEDAGAFAVECELIPAEVMATIGERTGMTTISLGSGPSADVMFLFTNDICGEGGHKPRHARAYADLASLQAKIDETRIAALREFRADVRNGRFPADGEIIGVDQDELAAFRRAMEQGDTAR